MYSAILSANKSNHTNANFWVNKFKRIKKYAKEASTNAFEVIVKVAEDMDLLVDDWYKHGNDGQEKIILYIDSFSVETAYNIVSLATAAQMCDLVPRVIAHQYTRFSVAAVCEIAHVSVCNKRHGMCVSMYGPVLAPEG
eukprot:3276781-Rhodomonas_salina.1